MRQFIQHLWGILNSWLSIIQSDAYPASEFKISLFMVELPWLLPLTPVVLLVGPLIDEEGDKEGGRHCEERRANAPENVWHPNPECSCEGFLLMGGEMVLCDASVLPH